MSKCKVSLRVLIAVLMVSWVAVQSVAATPLVDSTSVTVVHVTKNLYSHWITQEDVTLWKTWPNTDDDRHLELSSPLHERVYLSNVYIASNRISWDIYPFPTPWRGLPLLNSMIANVWSEDGGKTYTLASWDYLAPFYRGKDLHVPFDPNWIGTMVHSFCGFEGESFDKCNGRERSNLYFTNYPPL